MEERLSAFIKQFTGELIVNNKYITNTTELKEIIDNKVVKIKYNIKNKGWIIELDEYIIDNTNILEVVAL